MKGDLCSSCETIHNILYDVFAEDDENDYFLSFCEKCFSKAKEGQRWKNKKIVYEKFYTLIPHSPTRFDFFKKCITY